MAALVTAHTLALGSVPAIERQERIERLLRELSRYPSVSDLEVGGIQADGRVTISFTAAADTEGSALALAEAAMRSALEGAGIPRPAESARDGLVPASMPAADAALRDQPPLATSAGRADRLLREYRRRFPDALARCGDWAIRRADLAEQGLVWPDWCWLPMAGVEVYLSSYPHPSQYYPATWPGSPR